MSLLPLGTGGDGGTVRFGPQPWLIGVVNVTPDSFSDGGRFAATDAAVARGHQLVAEGAAVVDVGGESTRPGAHRVPVEEELRRVVPVVRELAAAGVACSVDTTRAQVADAAVAAGAVLVNDVSGGLADPAMVDVVAATGTPWVLMHWRGHSDVMGDLAVYPGPDGVTGAVLTELARQVDRALAAGIPERALVIDPGLGFAKHAAHNWELLRRLDALVGTGLPVLIGASRKRFLGELLGTATGGPRPADGREDATTAVSVLAALAGAWGVRVHEVRPSADAFAVLAAAGALDAGRAGLTGGRDGQHTDGRTGARHG